MKSKSIQFLNKLNKDYLKLHKDYEKYFWLSYMGDHSFDVLKDKAMAKRDLFRADPQFIEKINELLKRATVQEKSV
jgi:hypothetical protein